MFSINIEDGTIRLSAGDQVSFEVCVNTAIFPLIEQYNFTSSEGCYIEFKLYLANSGIVLLKKQFNSSGVCSRWVNGEQIADVSYEDYITSLGNLKVFLDVEDTENLLVGRYKYDIVAKVKKEDNSFTTQTIISKNDFYIL